MAKLLFELMIRSRLAAVLFCGGVAAFFVWFLVHCVRSLTEFGDAPTRITCAQAGHAPRWVTLETNLDCSLADVVHISNGDDRSYVPVACLPDEPPVQVALDRPCRSGRIAYTGDLSFDRKSNLWTIYTWAGPRNSRIGVFLCVGFIIMMTYLYIALEKTRRKRGIPPGKWWAP